MDDFFKQIGLGNVATTTQAAVAEQIPQQPEPLPAGEIKDVHAPKPRISLFKASRQKKSAD